MKTVDELFETAITNWRQNKAVGTALIPPPIDDRSIILSILQRTYARSPTANITIVVNNFSERIDIIEYLTQQEDADNNAEFKKLIQDKTLKVLTQDFIKNYWIAHPPFLCIMYHIDTMCHEMVNLLNLSKFKLVVLNRLMSDVKDMQTLYSICPLLDCFKQNEIDEIRTSTPVEEIQIGITIPDDTDNKKLLDYYDDYIRTSLSIFGSFDMLEQARVGNKAFNISATEVCSKLAQANGWDEHLDMSVEYNVEIDKLYNPGNIRDRAMQTYEIIRNRNQFLSDYEGKLDEILKIVKEHENENILIINKRGEFASKVTDFINNMSETIICGNYHDKVEPIPACDENDNPIYYKSGSKKGERRYIAAQAQQSRNEYLFSKHRLNVLSTSSAPNKSLCVNIDVIIITSPLCEDVKSYIYRLSNVRFPQGKIKLYTLYIKGTLEETKLANKPISETHKILNQENIEKNENNFDFILAD